MKLNAILFTVAAIVSTSLAIYCPAPTRSARCAPPLELAETWLAHHPECK